MTKKTHLMDQHNLTPKYIINKYILPLRSSCNIKATIFCYPYINGHASTKFLQNILKFIHYHLS